MSWACDMLQVVGLTVALESPAMVAPGSTRNIVYRQTPPAGARVVAGSTVILKVMAAADSA